jgi:hypothetical protein
MSRPPVPLAARRHRTGASVRRAGLTGLLAIMLTGGCSATPSASELVSAQTAASGKVSEAEAAGALLEYIRVLNTALRSGDPRALARMTAPHCPCEDLVAHIDDRYADGARLVGASFDAGELTVVHRKGAEADVRARVSVSEYDVHNGDGLVVATQPAREYVATYTVRRDGDTWRVVDVQPVRAS